MNMKMRQLLIESEIAMIEGGKPVSNKRIDFLLDKVDAIKIAMDQERAEGKSIPTNSKTLMEYKKYRRIACAAETRYENSYAKKKDSQIQQRLACAARSALEKAESYLIEMIQTEPDTNMWLKSIIDERGCGSSAELPAVMNPKEWKRAFSRKRTRAEVAVDLLNEKLGKMNPSPYANIANWMTSDYLKRKQKIERISALFG
jgi:hypothetical protein